MCSQCLEFPKKNQLIKWNHLRINTSLKWINEYKWLTKTCLNGFKILTTENYMLY